MITILFTNMEAKEYYYSHFRGEFAEFLTKTKMTHTHPGEGTYIPIQDLRQENLVHIPRENYMFFHCALAGTILIDQIMYTHFKPDYPSFQAITLYPKIEYGISNINARPWDITHGGIGLIALEKFFDFFVQDLKEFFSKHKFQTATWEAVKSAMLKDPDVIGGARGEIFRKILERS
jgi:hypothetical protein